MPEEQFNGLETMEYYRIVTSSTTLLLDLVVVFGGMVLMEVYSDPYLPIIQRLMVVPFMELHKQIMEPYPIPLSLVILLTLMVEVFVGMVQLVEYLVLHLSTTQLPLEAVYGGVALMVL